MDLPCMRDDRVRKRVVKVYRADGTLLGRAPVWSDGGTPYGNLNAYSLGEKVQLTTVGSGHRRGAYRLLQ